MNTTSLKTFVSLFDIMNIWYPIYSRKKCGKKEFKKDTDKYYTKGKYLIDK